MLQTLQKVGQAAFMIRLFICYFISHHAERTFVQSSGHRRPRSWKNVNNQAIRSSGIFSTLSRDYRSGFCSESPSLGPTDGGPAAVMGHSRYLIPLLYLMLLFMLNFFLLSHWDLSFSS